jgi:tetratricopeptide (TPR) repeat protein
MTPSASPTQSRWTAIALLLAGSVGVPGLVSYFNPEIAKNPKTAIPILILWELLVLIAGLVTDVWSKLRSRWVDRLVDPIDHALQALFSRYRRRYLDWIFYRHRDFDVKGLTTQSTYNLELEQVFVDLTIQPPPPGGTPADPLRPFPKELTGRRSIWDYLTSESFTDHLALIGAPGSGKTTLLKKIALQMTGRRRPKIRQDLPILLFLREHAEAILANPSPSLADVVSADLVRKQSSILPPAAWFKSWLDAGRCLVLLDGLDEVASQDVRQKVVAWVETQITAFPRNRFLISSRPHGYRSYPVPGVTVLEIQSFNRDQVRQFVQNWYRANEIHASGKLDPGVEMNAREGAEKLLHRLGTSRTLTDLAVNPLLLTMIANVHRFRSSLPGRRVELYAEILEVFLGKRDQARGIDSGLTPPQKQRVLQPIAYHLMKVIEGREIPVSEAVEIAYPALNRVAQQSDKNIAHAFLKDIANQSGLFIEKEPERYGFAHLAFQEYLTAVHIAEQGLSLELVEKISIPWWQEVIRLFAAKSDSSTILARCLAKEHPSVQELTLAIDCIEEALEVDPQWREKANLLIAQGAEDSSQERFQLAVETLLSRRIRNMIAVEEDILIDSTYVTNAEYQLFIDRMQSEGKSFQPDHWKSNHFPKGEALKPVLGIRGADAKAFCDWLSIYNRKYKFRLPRGGELAHYGMRDDDTDLAIGYWTTADSNIVFDPVKSHRGDLPHSYLSLKRRPEAKPDFTGLSKLQYDPILARDIKLADELDHDLSFGHDIEYTDDANRPMDLDKTLSLADALDLTEYARRDRRLNLIFDEVVELDREIAFDSSLDFAIGLDRCMRRALDRNKKMDASPEILYLFRWLARVFSFNLLIHTDWMQPFPNAKRRQWSSKFTVTQWTAELKRYALSAYMDFVVLESRITGDLPALEGLRIIGETRG